MRREMDSSVDESAASHPSDADSSDAQSFAGEGQPGPFSKLVDREWQDLCEKDGRTSPDEYPEMCLIQRHELAGSMSEAWFAGIDQGRLQSDQWQLLTDAEELPKGPFLAACYHGPQVGYLVRECRRIGPGIHATMEGSCIGWRPGHEHPAFWRPLPEPPR